MQPKTQKAQSRRELFKTALRYAGLGTIAAAGSLAAKKRRTTKKANGNTDIMIPISAKSTFRSKSNNGIISVSPPIIKKFKNVIASSLFIYISAKQLSNPTPKPSD